MKKIIVTGSSGLIGSAVSRALLETGNLVYGIDNNLREFFFGKEGSTSQVSQMLKSTYDSFTHIDIDIRHRQEVLNVFHSLKPDAVVHCAAQPSHDLAAKYPFEDFDTNALGTLNLLEANRRFSGDSPFVFLSTNKVYGDRPNQLELVELESRWDFSGIHAQLGINENMSIDQTKHSLFGSSKVAADIMVQEYGRYFQMPTVCLRGGCLTGPAHAGVELHGFISYLVKCCLTGKHYTIYGHSGKQVRDNIHSDDVAKLISLIIDRPPVGEVFNIGGGYPNAVSMLESIAIVEELSGKKLDYEYTDKPRSGDHIVYYTDLRKVKSFYPEWDVRIGIHDIFSGIISAWSP